MDSSIVWASSSLPGPNPIVGMPRRPADSEPLVQNAQLPTFGSLPLAATAALAACSSSASVSQRQPGSQRAGVACCPV